MIISEIINESLADWGNEWVHYSDHPMLTINQNQFHQDPAGIYFFPAKIQPEASMWHDKAYRYTAQLKPGARVLDVSTITDQQINQLVQAAGPHVVEQFNAYIAQYPPDSISKKFHMAWERIRAWFAYEGGKTRQFSSFNAMIRRLGWDAIFDDTGSIHVGEPQQLLVLNPRVLTNVRMDRQSGGSFAGMQRLYQDILAIAQRYGQVEASPIRKPNRESYFADQDKLLMATIRVVNPQNEENYSTISLYIEKNKPGIAVADKRYSNPKGHYAVAAFHIPRGDYDRNYNLQNFEQGLASTFQSIRESAADGDQYFNLNDPWVQETRNPKSRAALAYMSPHDFLSLIPHDFVPEKLENARMLARQGVPFRDVPRLSFLHDGKGNAKVYGHEGRHRSQALAELGVRQIPVILHSVAGGGGHEIRWGSQQEGNFDKVPVMPRVLHSQHGGAPHSIPFPQNVSYPMTETRKLPGPQVAGTGKDFRQKPGVNRSGRQPGHLAGSGKPMKVKPGFVG